MRGVVPARYLVEIERRTGRGIAEIFDLVAGTSTGSILATLCVRPEPPSAADMGRFYYDRGPRIFRRSWLGRELVSPKYSSTNLSQELRASIGAAPCRQAGARLLIPTVDADASEAIFIKSWEDYWADFPLWAAAAASCSAQTYFPAYSRSFHGRTSRFIDGGNHTNNPAASALFEAYRLWPGEHLLVVHLGTGKQTSPRPLPDGGLLRWAPLVFGTTSECQDDCARYFCTHAPRVRFFYFDVNIDRFPAMDDASSRTLDLLVEHAEHSIASEETKWRQCLDALQPDSMDLLARHE